MIIVIILSISSLIAVISIYLFFKFASNLYGLFVLLFNQSVLILSYASTYWQTGLKIDGHNVDHPDFIDRLYFSVVTWTTLGYGDIVPVRHSAKLIAASEAFAGTISTAFLIAATLQLIQEKRSLLTN